MTEKKTFEQIAHGVEPEVTHRLLYDEIVSLKERFEVNVEAGVAEISEIKACLKRQTEAWKEVAEFLSALDGLKTLGNFIKWLAAVLGGIAIITASLWAAIKLAAQASNGD